MPRPRKPAYISIQRVLRAILECTCGKLAEWQAGEGKRAIHDVRWLNKDSEMRYECDCVGPKSPSQLLAITKLDRNTLYRTCKYLTVHGILLRRVENRRGRHVTYAILDRLRQVPATLDYIPEINPEGTRQFQAIIEAVIGLTRDIEAFERLCRKHKRVIDSLHDIYAVDPYSPQQNWPMPDFTALVRFAETYGIHEGVQRYLQLRKLNPEESDAFKRIVAWGRFPTMDQVKAFVAYEKREDGKRINGASGNRKV